MASPCGDQAKLFIATAGKDGEDAKDRHIQQVTQTNHEVRGAVWLALRVVRGSSVAGSEENVRNGPEERKDEVSGVATRTEVSPEVFLTMRWSAALPIRRISAVCRDFIRSRTDVDHEVPTGFANVKLRGWGKVGTE